MPINIEMPKLSDTMTEGTLIKWNKQVGDEIEIGDVIAEVETDKATMEMEAFDEGKLTQILIQEGEKAAVGAVLGVLTEEGEDSSAVTAPAAESAAAPAAVTETPVKSAASAQPAASVTTTAGDRIKVSPLARKIAAEKGLDLTSVQGSGPAGRIVKADVENAVGGSAKPSSPLASTAKPQATEAPAPVLPTVAEEDQIVELSSMRRIIADRLLQSKTTIPHFYLHVEADTAPLMTLRKQVNAQAEQSHGNKYSVNDFVLKAVINAAQAVPEVNASYNGDNIVQFAKVGVSVAVAVDDGLVTPVVKDAANKSMLQISREVKDLAVRARDKKLKPNEFDEGTITVSNLGAWGIESFDAIINPPQAAILSVGAIVQKPVVKDGAIVPGQRMNIGLSCDHRVVDGAVGAKFLNEVKKLIENPALMLV